MPVKDDFFRVSEAPYGRGRVAEHQERPHDFSRLSGYPPKKDDSKFLQEALVRAVLKEAELPELTENFEKLPFKEAKKLEALRAIEMYLSAQLVQVRKEIQKITQESV